PCRKSLKITCIALVVPVVRVKPAHQSVLPVKTMPFAWSLCRNYLAKILNANRRLNICVWLRRSCRLRHRGAEKSLAVLAATAPVVDAVILLAIGRHAADSASSKR